MPSESYRIRRSGERQFYNHGWLKTYHTFSFGEYYDPHFMGFRDLRVINQDQVAPGKGFPTHPHQEMEILSIVLEGTLAHKDSTGTETFLKAGEIQVMSAGSGVTHSEYNPSPTEFSHFLQIWILPETMGVAPSYKQAHIDPLLPNQWKLLASKSGRDGSLAMHQDAALSILVLEEGQKKEIPLQPHRYGWLQVIAGELSLEENSLYKGDGVAFEPGPQREIVAKSSARLLFFDLK